MTPLNVLVYGDDWAPAGSWLMGQAYADLGHRVRYYSPGTASRNPVSQRPTMNVNVRRVAGR